MQWGQGGDKEAVMGVQNVGGEGAPRDRVKWERLGWLVRGDEMSGRSRDGWMDGWRANGV